MKKDKKQTKAVQRGVALLLTAALTLGECPPLLASDSISEIRSKLFGTDRNIQKETLEATTETPVPETELPDTELPEADTPAFSDWDTASDAGLSLDPDTGLPVGYEPSDNHEIRTDASNTIVFQDCVKL